MAKKSYNPPSSRTCPDAGGTYPAERVLELRATPELRSAGGSWFTPPSIAEELVNKVLPFLPISGSPEITDPSCGSGVFAGALQRSGRAFSFTGMDIDPDAVDFCRRQFPSPDFNFFTTDTLLDAPFRRKFDLVIGNPPFVALPGIPEEKRQVFRDKYSLAHGRFNLWELFIEWTIKNLKPGGIGALILPDRLWRNTGRSSVRNFIEENSEILEYGEYPSGTFPDAVVDSGYIIFSAGRKTPEQKRLRQNFCGDDPVISALSKISVPLEAVLDIRDGIIPGHHAGDIFLENMPDDPLHRRRCRKLLTGRDVFPEKIIYRNRYVDYRPEVWKCTLCNDKGIRLRQKDIFECPKILTRQTSDSIIAAWDAKGEYYYANTLHGGRLKTDNYYGDFLAAYLSGPLANYCYKHITKETGRPFAQVKIALLRTVPVPVMSKKEQEIFLANRDFIYQFAGIPVIK